MKGKQEKLKETMRKDHFNHAQKHADIGTAEAQYHLGLMYDTGTGTERDPMQAFFWYLKAAEQGNTDAMYYIGRLYESTDSGFEHDPDKAAEWYCKAADLDHPLAKTKVSFIYN